MSLFWRTYKIELAKLLKRKEIFLLCLMPALSLFYAIGVAANSSVVSYNGTDLIDAASFVGTMAVMLHGLGIFYIIFAFMSAKSLGSEIEDKSMFFYIPRIRDRKTLYNAKWTSLVTVLLLSVLVFILISVVVYFALVTQRTDIANGLLYQPDLLFENIAWVLSFVFIFVFSASLALVLSIHFKTVISVCIYLFAYIILSLAAGFPTVQYFSPIYYVNAIGENGANNAMLLFLCLVLTAIYSIILNIVGKHSFHKKDL